MKHLYHSVFSIIICTFLIHASINSMNTKEIMRMRNEILVDQIQDYASQIAELRSRRTYEEGINDGFLNSKNVRYAEGYHKALQDKNPFTELMSGN